MATHKVSKMFLARDVSSGNQDEITVYDGEMIDLHQDYGSGGFDFFHPAFPGTLYDTASSLDRVTTGIWVTTPPPKPYVADSGRKLVSNDDMLLL